MSDLCNSPTTAGHSCGYPPNACPLHIRVWPSPGPGEQPPQTHNSESLKPVAELVITRLNDGLLTPLEAIRWLRAIRAFLDMPISPLGRERALREVELRGVVMNGFPPRDEDEWALAKEVFDDAAIAEFHRWDETGHGW